MTKQDDDEKKKRQGQEAAGISAGESVNQSLKVMEQTYWRPDKYAGNRKLYDDGAAKRLAKDKLFSDGKTVKDPYTGKKLLLRKQDAKAQFGEHWQEHLAESDHVVPVHKVYEEYKDDPWLTNDDLKEAINSDENIQVVNRKYNNAKRDRTQKEFVEDKQYRKDKNVKLSKKSAAKALKDGEKAQAHIERTLAVKKVKNVATEFHASGTNAAYNAMGMTAAMVSMDNIVAVLKGEKDAKEAIKDVTIATGKSAAVGYVTGGSLSVVARSLSSSSSPLVKSLVQSSVPGKVVGAVMATGDVLYRYAKGEISTVECIGQLGQRGVSTVTTGYAMAAGQALIPIPFVGAAVGAMVGAAFSGAIWNGLQKIIGGTEVAEAEYLRAKAEADAAIARMRQERANFIAATNQLFAERAQAINAGFDTYCAASIDNDFNQMAMGLNQIAASFGRDIGIHNFDDFDKMMQNDSLSFDL